MTPEQLTTLILSILGILLQLALRYAPKLSNWYQTQSNKGLIALGLCVVIGGVYFGLSCTPYAAMLKIALTCTTEGAFALLSAIFNIALSQQLTYLVTPKFK